MLKLKQGESFSLDGQYQEDDGITPKALTGVTITSQIRNKNNLVATLMVEIVDELQGRYRLSASEGTTEWPIGMSHWDVKYSLYGVVRLTDTVSISIERAITKI